jgi:hypothetical protein
MVPEAGQLSASVVELKVAPLLIQGAYDPASKFGLASLLVASGALHPHAPLLQVRYPDGQSGTVLH